MTPPREAPEASREGTLELAVLLALGMAVLLEVALLVSFGILAGQAPPPHAPTSTLPVALVSVCLAGAAFAVHSRTRISAALLFVCSALSPALWGLLAHDGWTPLTSGRDGAIAALLLMHLMSGAIGVWLTARGTPGSRAWTGFVFTAVLLSAWAVSGA